MKYKKLFRISTFFQSNINFFRTKILFVNLNIINNFLWLILHETFVIHVNVKILKYFSYF